MPSAHRALQAAGAIVRGKAIRVDNADDEPGGLAASGGIDVRARKLRTAPSVLVVEKTELPWLPLFPLLTLLLSLTHEVEMRDRRYDDRGGYDRGFDRYDDRYGPRGGYERGGFERGREVDRGFERGRDFDRRGGHEDFGRARDRSSRERGRRDEHDTRHMPGHKTLFVGSLSDDVTEEALREKFGTVGEVRNIRWVNDRHTGKFRGCCFVEFATEAQCLRAIDLNGVLCSPGLPVAPLFISLVGDTIMHRPMRVDFAEDRRDSNVAPHMMAPNAGLAVTQEDLDKVIARNKER